MNDLKLGFDHDLDFSDGDLSLLNEESLVATQTLEINLLFFEGEWFLDNTYGIPYLQTILKKGVPKAVVDTIIYDAAINSYNIKNILAFSSSISPDRVYTLEVLQAETTEGEIVSITNLQI